MFYLQFKLCCILIGLKFLKGGGGVGGGGLIA